MISEPDKEQDSTDPDPPPLFTNREVLWEDMLWILVVVLFGGACAGLFLLVALW